MYNVSLATIGVCVFCASASVGALFAFLDRIELKRSFLFAERQTHSPFVRAFLKYEHPIYDVGHFKISFVVLHPVKYSCFAQKQAESFANEPTECD